MKKPTINQILAVAVIVAVSLNTYQHYSHPAYRYYVDNIHKLREDFKAFKLQVANDFVPAVSNGFLRAANVNISNQVAIIARKFSSTSRDSKSYGSSGYSEKPILPNFHFHDYMEISGVPYVHLGTKWYTVGDELLGQVIDGITPDVVLIGGRYYDVKNN